MPKIQKKNENDEVIDQQDQMDSMFNHRMNIKSDEPEELKNVEEPAEGAEPPAGGQAKDTSKDAGNEAGEQPKEEPGTSGEEPKEGKQPPAPDDDVIERLRRRVAELETSTVVEAEQPPPQEPQQPAQPQQEEPAPQPLDFITEEEYDELQSNPAKLNEIMQRVYQRAVADTSEQVFRQIPELVQASSARQITLAEAVRQFYTDNPDLRKHAQYVGFVANQVKSKNPGMDLKGVLVETEKQVREHLSISKQAEQQEQDRRKAENGANKPAFVQGGSAGQRGSAGDVRTDFQKQADEMLKSLRR